MILRGGYALDSFMVRYQGVDRTNKANWECNSRSASSETGPASLQNVPFRVAILRGDYMLGPSAKEDEKRSPSRPACFQHDHPASNGCKLNSLRVPAPTAPGSGKLHAAWSIETRHLVNGLRFLSFKLPEINFHSTHPE